MCPGVAQVELYGGQKLKLSSNVTECKPLPAFRDQLASVVAAELVCCPPGPRSEIQFQGFCVPIARGLHSSTFQLNLSAFYGIGGARRGCAAVLRVFRMSSCVRHGSS